MRAGDRPDRGAKSGASMIKNKALILRDGLRSLLDEGHALTPGNQADFFLSSSTSVNSASTTSSFLPASPPDAAPSPEPG